MATEDEIYLTMTITRNEVEARFAKTGTPAKERSIELIGDCLREVEVDMLKDVILDCLLVDITKATRAKLKEKGQ